MALRLGMKTLIAFSQQMGTMLDAGIPIRRALAISERGARGGQKYLYARLGRRIEDGAPLGEALDAEGRRFPPMYRRLVKVGEVTGDLARVFRELGNYYAFLRSMWHRVISGLVWPLFEYWALWFVLALLAWIAQTAGVPVPIPFTPAGALGTGAFFFFAPILLYFLLTRTLGGLRVVHEILMRVPPVGGLLRTMALARFSWAMEMMTSAGVRILDAIVWSCEATANGAFEARSRGMVDRLKDGLTLRESLERSGLFPIEYLEMVHVAQESGSLPEMFGRLARNYFEKMENALRILARALGILVWIIVACVIIYFIFLLAANIGRAYHDALNIAH